MVCLQNDIISLTELYVLKYKMVSDTACMKRMYDDLGQFRIIYAQNNYTQRTCIYAVHLYLNYIYPHTMICKNILIYDMTAYMQRWAHVGV